MKTKKANRKQQKIKVCRQAGILTTIACMESEDHNRWSIVSYSYLKPQSHIHGFCPGRATVHPDLSNRGASAWFEVAP